MTITTSDCKRQINIGSSTNWISLYSTILVRLNNIKDQLCDVLTFMKGDAVPFSKGLQIARQFNIIRDELSKYKPEEAVYDFRNPEKEAPWKNRLNPIITSCANMFLTADGKDLLFELVSIFTYSEYMKVQVIIQG